MNLFSIHERPEDLDLDILFSPSVNYHKTSMSELKKVASRLSNCNENETNFNTNYLEIIPYTLTKETDDEAVDIESVYTLYTKDTYDSNTIKYHEKAVFIDNQKSTDLGTILKAFSTLKLDKIEDLMEVKTKLDIAMDISTEDNFTSKYREFKELFQVQYRIFFAYIEGVHRSTLFAKFAEKSPLTNCIGDTEEKSKYVFENMKILSSPYHVRLYLFPSSQMPSVDDLKERSLCIRKNQELGFKFTLTNVASNCKEIFLDNQRVLNSFEESEWIAETNLTKDKFVLNRRHLMPIYLQNLLQKGPIAEKYNYDDAQIAKIVKDMLDKLKLGFFIPSSCIRSKTNPGKQWPREAKIFLDLLTLASFNSAFMGKFHLMLEGITSEIRQDTTLKTSIDFNDFKFYEDLLFCVRCSTDYYYQHHMWYMYMLQPGKSFHFSTMKSC